MKFFFISGLIFTSVLLTACQPEVFGMPQDQWNQLTPEQQQQVIAGYNQRKLIETQNEPYVAAIHTLGDVAQTAATSN